MNKKINKLLSGILALVMVFALFTTQISAQSVDSEIDGLATWLQNSDNTGFDFTDTNLDTDICWTVLALAKAEKSNYSEFESYINNVVSTNYSTLLPANFALIYLSADAYGLDTTNIGGHDMLAELENIDYTSQIYLSSLYYPLIALDYKEDTDCDAVKQSIVQTILAGQQPDGGFPYCTIDSGWGISSDVDTTSFVIQALSDFSDDATVATALNSALAYVETQKFADGSYGYVDYMSPSAESTAQTIIAKLCLNEDCDDSVTALKSYINPTTGAAKNYMDADDTMTSYQTLLALADVKIVSAGGKGIYKYEAPVQPEDPTQETTQETTTQTESTTQGEATSVEATTSSNNKVDIPRTGGKTTITVFLSAALVAGAAVYTFKKKDEE